MYLRKTVLGWLTFLSTLCVSTATVAAQLPSPIRIVVPFAPGGANDILARALAGPLGQELGVTVLVENRSIGAAGSIAAKAVSRETPDGSVLLLGNTASLGINPHIYRDTAGYDPRSDLEPVSTLGTSSLVLVLGRDVQANSVDQFIEHLKEKPGQLAYASAGSGSPLHLAAEMFMLGTGTSMVHVPYKGTAPAYVDLLAGRVDVMFDNTTTATRYVSGGQVNALAVTGKERSRLFPDIPTFSEVGIPGMDEMTVWFGLVAPKGTPADVRERIAQGVRAALKDAKVQEQLAMLDIAPTGSTPAEMKAFIDREYGKWGDLIQAAGIRAE